MENKNIGKVIGEGVIIAVSSMIIRGLIDSFPKIVEKTKDISKNVAEKRANKCPKTDNEQPIEVLNG